MASIMQTQVTSDLILDANFPSTKRMDVQDLNFFYAGNKQALNNIELTIEKKQVTARS